MHPFNLAVIVPTLNEAGNIPSLLRCLNDMRGVTEIVIADGGSHDATAQLAHDGGATVVTAPRNRGAQLNAGARAARGDVLWFLHADARPHPGSALAIRQALALPRVLGGNFRLRFDAAGLAPRVFETIARLQRYGGVYYGDSSLFMRRAVFEALGGYRAWPLFEDYDLARRLERHARRAGSRTVCLPLPIIVSARRFRDRPLHTLVLWMALQTLFALGVSPQRLAQIYHRVSQG